MIPESLLRPYQQVLAGEPADDPVMSLTDMLMKLAAGDSGSTGGYPPPSGPVPGDARSWVNRAIDITNVPESWRRPLLELLSRENAPGDPRAYNPNPVESGEHAMGLFQTIPSTFEAHNLPRLGGIYDPVANAVAAIRYIQGRYGTPFNLPASGGY